MMQQYRQPQTIDEGENAPKTVARAPEKITQLQCQDQNLYLKDVFVTWFSEGFRYLPNLLGSIYPEIELLVNFIEYRFTVAVGKPQVGDYLQNLNYKKNVTKKQRVLFLLLSVILPYLKKRFMMFVEHQQTQPDNNSPIKEIILHVGKVIRLLEKILSLISFVNSAIFIRNGKFRNLSQRLTQMEMQFSNPESSRVLNFTLMNRVLLWQIYEMFLKTVLPHAHNFLSEAFKSSFYFHSYLQEGDKGGSGNRNCVFCDSKPTMAMQAVPCGHRACFYCVLSDGSVDNEKQEDSQSFCKRCSQKVSEWKKLYQ